MSLLICVSILIGNPPTVTHELYKNWAWSCRPMKRQIIMLLNLSPHAMHAPCPILIPPSFPEIFTKSPRDSETQNTPGPPGQGIYSLGQGVTILFSGGADLGR